MVRTSCIIFHLSKHNTKGIKRFSSHKFLKTEFHWISKTHPHTGQSQGIRLLTVASLLLIPVLCFCEYCSRLGPLIVSKKILRVQLSNEALEQKMWGSLWFVLNLSVPMLFPFLSGGDFVSCYSHLNTDLWGMDFNARLKALKHYNDNFTSKNKSSYTFLRRIERSQLPENK